MSLGNLLSHRNLYTAPTPSPLSHRNLYTAPPPPPHHVYIVRGLGGLCVCASDAVCVCLMCVLNVCA